ncbi:MAG: hypothetical protein HQ546_02935 [Planctomycetes bacterium]|nr:hypothetical protein [Planctomycetota bacterium]
MSPKKSLLRRVFASVHFVIVMAILLPAAAGWNAAINHLGIVLAKAKVPLLSSLEELPSSFGTRFTLAEAIHWPEEGIYHGKATLTDDVVETLGTKDFISWFYKDNIKSKERSLAYIRVHVAYYTGLLDAVPHVPDACMLAGGAQKAGESVVTWRLPDLPAQWRNWQQVDVRRSAFTRRTARSGQVDSLVYYVFSVNGAAANSREQVRTMLADPRDKYCYYAKVELEANRFGLRNGYAKALTVAEQDEMCQAFFAASAKAIFEHFPSQEYIKNIESNEDAR